MTAVCSALASSAADASVTWPADQLMPSFSAPATTQDLITLRGASPRWEAESGGLGHATGHADGDGWLCQVGVDVPGRHMVYGPYTTGLPAGENTARFRLKIDNNTADNAHQVTIDVRDNVTGAVLASQMITRQQFTVAGDWVTFSLPFTVPAPGHGIELRVYWVGGAYIKVDWVSADRGPDDHLVLFASLKGVVNMTQPRIFSYEGDAFAEGPHTWLQSLGLSWTEVADPWTLITKYRTEIAGVIVYDDAQPDTINLATTMAGPRKALVTSAALLPRLMGAPYNLTVLEDLRGRFTSKVAVYQYLHDQIWPNVTHRVVVGASPIFHKAAVREYIVAIGAAAFWLDPYVPAESAILDRFLDEMGPGDSYLGWWPEEGPGVERASRFGIPTIASDYATNLTMHGGMPRTIAVKDVPPKPPLENKMYVAFILSDGDNLQYVEHLMRKLWNDPGRGHVPMGWTVSPAMVDAMPGALSYYFTSASADDNLISGPSGYGYAYPNVWPSDALLEDFTRRTDDYVRRAGLRVVTIWNTITGGIDADVGAAFARHAPSLLGVTAQNTGGGLTVYDSSMPGFALSCNYCTNEQAIKNHIASAASGWNGQSPRFILIQAQPWQGVTPTTFKNVKESLDASYRVVRPDVWFQLLRQQNGLRIEPIAPIGNGRYRLVSRASGLCLEAVAGGNTEQATCAETDAQLWDVTATDRAYARIVAATGATLGNNGAQWQPMWKLGDHYQLLARQTDDCLDVPNGSTMEHAVLQHWACNGTNAQAFDFRPPQLPPPPPDDDATDAGVDLDAANDAAPPPTGEDGDPPGGCCSADGGPTNAMLAGIVLLLVGARRRRRSASREIVAPAGRISAMMEE
jgi:MYXO-CTERM domain-containing protein